MVEIHDRIERRPIESLIPYARNARTHSDEQVAQIAASIKEWGWTIPILVDPDGQIIAGHGRVMAARKLGLTEVPVIVAAGWTEAQKRAYVIADNKLALNAGWDNEMLALELGDLQELGFDLDLTGFDADALAELLADEEPQIEGRTEDDAIPEMPEEPVSRPGDIWRLGEHRIICADSADSAAIERLMAGERAALLFTSPPYANQRDYTTGGIADWDALMQGVFGAASAALREDAQILVNLGLVHRDNEWQPYWDGWIAWMRTQGFRRFGWYVWDQSVTVPGDWAGRLAPRHEFVFHFNRQSRKPNKIVPCKYAGQDVHLRSDGTSTGGLRSKAGERTDWTHAGQPTQDFRIPDSVITVTRQRVPIDKEREIDHPAVFPIGLPKFFIEAYTDAGEIVFEPFSGSGTTILAGEACGRRVMASELAPEYVDVAVIRWIKNHPDQTPVLEATGQTFDEVAAARA